MSGHLGLEKGRMEIKGICNREGVKSRGVGPEAETLFFASTDNLFMTIDNRFVRVDMN